MDAQAFDIHRGALRFPFFAAEQLWLRRLVGLELGGVGGGGLVGIGRQLLQVPRPFDLDKPAPVRHDLASLFLQLDQILDLVVLGFELAQLVAVGLNAPGQIRNGRQLGNVCPALGSSLAAPGRLAALFHRCSIWPHVFGG